MALSNLFPVFPAGSFSNSFLKVFRCVQLRQLNLQEYASKKLLAHYGINIQKFDVATTPKEAAKIGRSLMADTADELVIKAQILAGGRGKGVFENGFKGGVKLTKDVNTVEDIASKMLGFRLTTKQTPPNGVLVKKLMVCESLTITRETYIAILMDREANGPVIVASPEGGVDIEEVAEKNPSKILKASLQIRRLYNLFNGVDAVQVEINPFGETDKDEVVCFDAKINFDDNAKFRQKAIFEMDDHSEADPRELEADKYNLNYIPLDGNIACMVNGAGLAMATMDIIKLNGGWPANFLDLGGGVTENGVYHGFKLLTSDPKVRCILVNIFGGIVDCAVIARGITKAYQSMNLSVPVVVRLEGTNVDEAKRILTESQMPIKTAENLDDAAKKAVASF